MKNLLSHLVITYIFYKEKNLNGFLCNSWIFQTTFLSYDFTGLKKVVFQLANGVSKKNRKLKHFSMGLHIISQTTHVVQILESLFDIIQLKKQVHSMLRMNENSIGTAAVIRFTGLFSAGLSPVALFPVNFCPLGLFSAGLIPARSFPRQVFSLPVFPPTFLNNDIN